MTAVQEGVETEASEDPHSAFVDLYEGFLDAAYQSPSDKGNDRWKLVQGILKELTERGVRTVLDCAAGTGFPAIELASHDSLPGLKIHTTDADLEMLKVLRKRVGENEQLTLWQFVPPRKMKLGCNSAGSLQLAWHNLSDIRRTYDYVMCRGNSLTYGNTWTGGRDVGSSGAVRAYLGEMKKLVRPGGYLHVDAPRRLELPEQCYRPVKAGGVSIWERVTNEQDCRHWTVTFELETGETRRFDRYSTLLTISEVKGMLDELGFEQTNPISLYGERSGFGVIIAKRPDAGP